MEHQVYKRRDGRGDKKLQGSYANVNGLKMYYEIHGEGRPLILLHGALSTIDVDFGKVLPVTFFATSNSRVSRPTNRSNSATRTSAWLSGLGCSNSCGARSRNYSPKLLTFVIVGRATVASAGATVNAGKFREQSSRCRPKQEL